MPIKVFDAYKVVNPGNLWRTLSDIRSTARTNVAKKYKEYLHNSMTEVDPYSEKYLERIKEYDPGSPSREWKARYSVAWKELSEASKASVLSVYKNEYNTTVKIIVNKHGRNYYLRIIDDQLSFLYGALQFLENYPEVVEYHYQDFSEKPDEISSKEWRQRKKVWTSIADSGDAQLVLEISDHDDFWEFARINFNQEYENVPVPLYEAVLAEKLKSHYSGDIVSVPGKIASERFTIELVNESWIVKIEECPSNVVLLVKAAYTTLAEAVDIVGLACMPEDQRSYLIRLFNQSNF